MDRWGLGHSTHGKSLKLHEPKRFLNATEKIFKNGDYQ